jgi:opacity protein-like surface antigen
MIFSLRCVESKARNGFSPDILQQREMQMNMMKQVLVAFLGATLVAQPCVAAEAKKALDEHSTFSGVYVGAGLAADYITAQIHDDDVSDSNIAYSALIGWRHQMENDWVFGVEGALGDRKGNLSNDSARFKFGYNWHWSAITGKAFGTSKDQLLYAKLGVGGIQVNGNVQGQGIPSHNFKGTRWVIGYERALTTNVHVKVETSYISYDKNFEQIQTAASFMYRF